MSLRSFGQNRIRRRGSLFLPSILPYWHFKQRRKIDNHSVTRLWPLLKRMGWGRAVLPHLIKKISIFICPIFAGFLFGEFTFNRRLALFKSKAQKKKNVKAKLARAKKKIKIKRGKRGKIAKKKQSLIRRFIGKNLVKRAQEKEKTLLSYLQN